MHDTSFATTLRHARKLRNLTQEALAEKAGLSTRAISDLERGINRRPHRHTLESLAYALDLKDEDLRQFEEAATHPEPESTQLVVSSGTLPRSPNKLIGRERQVDEILELLGAGAFRLLTLTGPGGVGKTRLAIEVAGQSEGATLEGTRFVPLAPAAAASEVPRRIAGAFGLFDLGTHDIPRQINKSLGADRILVILDNLEHLLDAGPFLAQLGEEVSGITLLATSRSPVGIAGETVYRLDPLELPQVDAGSIAESPDSIRNNAAIELFLERAQQSAGFANPSEQDYLAVSRICRRLDGLPLAIELIAPWLISMSPAQLEGLLSRETDVGEESQSSLLDLLDHGSKDQPTRLQSARNAVDWSVRLLGAQEQAAFRCASIFAGSWSLESFEEVCGPVIRNSAEPDTPKQDGSAALAATRKLIEKNLVAVDYSSPQTARYHMFETIRAHAFELAQANLELGRLKHRHIDHFLQLAERVEPELLGPDQRAWLDRLELEHDNIRAAIRAAHKLPDIEAALRFCGALWRFWSVRGFLVEGRDLIETTLELATDPAKDPPGCTDYLATTLQGAGSLSFRLGNYEDAASALSRCIECAEFTGSSYAEARATTSLAHVYATVGEPQLANQHIENAARLLDETNHPREYAELLVDKGVLACSMARYDLAIDYLEQGIQRVDGSNRPTLLAGALSHLSLAQSMMGRYDDASEALSRSVEILELLGDRWALALALERRAVALERLGRNEQVSSDRDRCQSLRRSIGLKAR